MNKCVKCGSEYEGNFCPMCGTPADGVSSPIPHTAETGFPPPVVTNPVMEGSAPDQRGAYIPQPVRPAPQAGSIPESGGGEPAASGTAFQSAEQPPAPPFQPQPAPFPPMGGAGAPPYGVPVQPQKKKKTCLIVGLCVAGALVLLVIIGAIIGFFAFKDEVKAFIEDDHSGGYTERSNIPEDDNAVSYDVTGAVTAQNGATIRVDQIDYADDQTRIYLTVQNHSGDTFHLFQHNVTVTVNGKQYEADYNLGDEYDAIPSDLADGSNASGVVFFPRMDPDDDMTITIKAYSDDVAQDFEDYVFTIEG